MTGEIFFIDYKTDWSDKNFKFLKSIFPFVIKIEKQPSIYDAIKIASLKSKTYQFWIVDGSIKPLANFKFNFDITKWDVDYIHSFNVLVDFKLVNGGIYTATKDSRNEIKQTKQLVGIDNSKKDSFFDIVFISYNEANADLNYEKLKYHTNKEILRVHGVKGIHNAHREAALKSSTSMFWVVDADAEILPNFKFNYIPLRWEHDTVYVWKSINPVNDLKYGYGGVKLLPRQLVLDMDLNSVDMTTSISHKFKTISEASNYTAFNTDPFSTWKSAFRECVKLSSNIIDDNFINIKRLDIWCSKAEGNYASEALLGARSGRKYGEENKGNLNALAMINDFDWLQSRWQAEKS